MASRAPRATPGAQQRALGTALSPFHDNRGVLPASAERQSRVCELAAGLRFCCPGSKAMPEFLSKKTDWEREDCSMHLLVSQKAQTRRGGTQRQQGTTPGGPAPRSGRELAPQARLWPEPCPEPLPGRWAGCGQVPGARAAPASSICSPRLPCHGRLRPGARRNGGSAASPEKVPGQCLRWPTRSPRRRLQRKATWKNP